MNIKNTLQHYIMHNNPLLIINNYFYLTLIQIVIYK
jgi:hypothetical protein